MYIHTYKLLKVHRIPGMNLVTLFFHFFFFQILVGNIPDHDISEINKLGMSLWNPHGWSPSKFTTRLPQDRVISHDELWPLAWTMYHGPDPLSKAPYPRTGELNHCAGWVKKKNRGNGFYNNVSSKIPLVFWRFTAPLTSFSHAYWFGDGMVVLEYLHD